MSLRSDTMTWALITLVVVVIGAAAMYVIAPQLRPSTTLRLGDGVFTADVINQSRGASRPLSESRYLQENQALLVIHPEEDHWPISTKNLENSFDVVWLNEDRKVVYIVKNIHSDSVGVTEYTPKQGARYTIELPVGTVTKRAIAIGSTAVFDDAGRLGLN